MSDTYITLAKQLVAKNTLQSYQKFEALLLDSSNIEGILQSAKYSEQLLFATCEILAKAILKGDFLSVQQIRSDDGGDYQKGIELQRIRVYSMIMLKIFPLANSNNSAHIQRTCLNLVSVCLKCILQKSVTAKLTPQTLQQYFGIILPGFIINESFINNFNTEIVIIKPNENSLPQNFQKAIKILVSMMQYITINAYYKTYYDFRRNIYTIRNTGLPYILNISIYYIKCLFNYWQNARGNIDQYLVRNMSLILQLLDTVMMFPFTLSLHQYDHQNEGNEISSGYTSQIYFPSYFRNILCDASLITYIVKYYSVLMSKYFTGTSSQSKFMLDDLKKLVRIIGRYLNANSYCFNTDIQRINFRSHCLLQAIILANQCKCDDPYLISLISQVLQKIMCSYTTSDYAGGKSNFLKVCFIFAHNLVNTKITLFQGKKNPFHLGFELIDRCINETEDTPDQSNAKQAAQAILQQAMKRISDNKETELLFKEFNNPTNEIECFEELFSNVSAIFNAKFQKNIAILAEIDFQTMNQYSHQAWLHFAASVLPNHRANNQHTRVILKFFELAKAYSNMAGLHYLHVLTEQLLTNMQQGTSVTSLWNNIEEITNENFSPFIRFILKKCCASFTIPNNALLDYSLQIIKSIYSKLKKYNKPQFESLYQLIQQVLSNMNATVFVQPKFFKKRIVFFNVVSVIYLNGSQIKYIYQIYNIILEQYKGNETPLNFLKFMNDVTGILQGIEVVENFNIFCQIALKDLLVLIPKHLNPSSIQQLFSEAPFLKGFLKLVLALSNDACRRFISEVHNRLSLITHQLFYPYLCEAIKYDCPKIIVQVWYKFIPLQPTGSILPISSQFKSLDSNCFNQMLRQYFNNIHRVQNLQVLYPFIEDNIQFLIQWWDQVMNRGLKPQINLKDVAEARIWSSRRQKQNFAKLLYYLGKYDEQYWRVPTEMNEREFVNNFIEKFT